MNQNDVCDEKIQNHGKIVQLLSPIEKEVEQSIRLPLKLIDIRRMSKERHGIAHQPLRTIEEQKSIYRRLSTIGLRVGWDYPIPFHGTNIFYKISVLVRTA
jgi:hypothetical protein